MAQIITNTPLVERNARYGRWITTASLLVILAPLVFTLPALITGNADLPTDRLFILYGALILGLILSNVGGYFLNRWGLKYFERVNNALKGTDKKYRLYNYSLPVNNVLLTPYGVTVFLLKNLEGRIYASQKGWNMNTNILGLLRYFSTERLGDPSKDLDAEIEKLRAFVAERLGPTFQAPIDGLILFTNPRAIVEVTNVELPIVLLSEGEDALKNALKKPKGTPVLSKSVYDALYELFEEEAEARQVEAQRGLVIAGRKRCEWHILSGAQRSRKVCQRRNLNLSQGITLQISLMIEGQAGLTWERWKQLVSRVEQWGFYGLYRSDHFVMPDPPDDNSLEMIVSLTYLADHTSRALFGPMVAPVSFRDPVMLARQAANIDELSGGRMVLGVGAGWMAREHEMFGYALLDKPARMERFAEGLHVVWSLLRSDEPVSFEGRWYTLREAQILPRAHKTRIMVGGNGLHKTMPLAAKYADVWNAVGIAPEKFAELSGTMDRYLYDQGRAPQDLKKTLATFMLYGRDNDALERRVARYRKNPEYRDLPLRDLLAMNRIAGQPADVIPQIQAYADAGVEELMLQILDSDDMDGLNHFAENVMPYISTNKT